MSEIVRLWVGLAPQDEQRVIMQYPHPVSLHFRQTCFVLGFFPQAGQGSVDPIEFFPL